jgi:hypothetical protein
MTSFSNSNTIVDVRADRVAKIKEQSDTMISQTKSLLMAKTKFKNIEDE